MYSALSPTGLIQWALSNHSRNGFTLCNVPSQDARYVNLQILFPEQIVGLTPCSLLDTPKARNAFMVCCFCGYLCLKLRVACGNLWHYSLSRRDLPDILLSAARSLFEQIIYAHKKSFGEEKYAEILATFDCIHGHKNKVIEAVVEAVADDSTVDTTVEPSLNVV
ncbi:hypothetical protein IFM89_010781 [Coptis chinensis]|uniref:Uncharacterized protein n=1 Tax=Coptis chinensis TaxID=261450 RepID=A0A835IW83_9MAGN|nr:hypothetical protein IFM89_010781 [Coptis chinensis]